MYFGGRSGGRSQEADQGTLNVKCDHGMVISHDFSEKVTKKIYEDILYIITHNHKVWGKRDILNNNIYMYLYIYIYIIICTMTDD